MEQGKETTILFVTFQFISLTPYPPRIWCLDLLILLPFFAVLDTVFPFS